jgi:hypothetical protein
MCVHRSVYRGYAITLSGADAKWSFRVERIFADLPMLSRPISDGHTSRGTALTDAKQHIDQLLSE